MTTDLVEAHRALDKAVLKSFKFPGSATEPEIVSLLGLGPNSTHLPLSVRGTIFRTYVRTSRKPARHPWIRPRGYWYGPGGASGGAGGWGEGYCA